MWFLALLAGAIVKDYVGGVSSPKGTLTISARAIDWKSNVKTYIVNCTLHVNNKSNNSKFLHILENRVLLETEIVNDFTISYTTHINTNNSECGEKRYTCEYFGAKIDEQVISVGEPPTAINPAKFKCISENLNYLHCQFPATHNLCQFGTSYSLLMIHSESLESCKLTKVNDSFRFDSRDQSCQYPVDEEVIEFRVRATNQFGSVTQKIVVDHYDVVRPAAPHSVDLKSSEGNRQWVLSWKSKKNLNYFGRKFEYNFKCKNESFNEIKHMIFSWLLGEHKCREPKLRLRVIPQNANQEEAIWSDWGIYDPLSKGFAPRSGHRTRLLDESIKERVAVVFNYIENTNQSMTIEVFWHREPTWNDSNMVAVSSSGIPISPSSKIILPTFGTAKFENLIHDKYSIILKGIPTSETALLVQPIIAQYQPTFKKLINNNKSFELSWFPPDNKNDLQGYTVMYCRHTTTNNCEESVVFQKLPPTDTSFNIYSDDPLNIAISTEFSNYTSSLVWQQCIISPTATTHHKLPKFHFYDVFSNSAKLRLEISCEDRSLYELLQIHVIDTTSGKTVKTRAHQPHKSVVDILDLAADTSYEVLVVAYNGSNVPHEARSRLDTKKTAGNDRLSIYIAAGVVLLIAVASSTYRVTVRIRAIMNIEVEFPFGLLGIDEEPVKICVENEGFRSDGRTNSDQKKTKLEFIQEEELGDDLACGQCGLTPSKFGEIEVGSQQQDVGYISVDVIKKKGI